MRHLRNIVLFALLLVGLDRLVGTTFRSLYFRTRSGEGGGLINRALSQNPEVLILGSSRAKHHFDPEIISKTLGMSAYNAGINGQDFLYAAMLLDVRRQTDTPPKIILFHVDRGSFGEDERERTKAKVFSYYLERSDIVRETLLESFVDRLKYLSLAYRANGKALPILSNLKPRPESENGFIGLKGLMNVPLANERSTPAPWKFKLKLLDHIARHCRASGTKLVFVNSPRFIVDDIERKEHEVWRAQMTEILRPYPEIEFLEVNSFSQPDKFQRAELYRDSDHLNDAGAELFSRVLAEELKQRLGARESSHETPTAAKANASQAFDRQ